MDWCCTCLLACAGVLGLPLSWDNTGCRRVIWRATRSFIIEWRACLSSTGENRLAKSRQLDSGLTNEWCEHGTKWKTYELCTKRCEKTISHLYLQLYWNYPVTEYWRLERSTLFLIALFPHLISGQVLSCLEKLTKEKYSPCIAWTDIIQPWGWTRPLSPECWKPVLFTWLSGEASRTSYALGDGDWCVCVCF